MVRSLILTPALSGMQNHLLTPADPGSSTLSQTTCGRVHSHLHVRRGFIAERKIALKYMGLDRTTAVTGRKTGLGNCVASSPFGDMKHCSGGGENTAPESSAPLPRTDKHRASLIRVPSRAASYHSPLKFLSRPFSYILPSPFFARLSGPDHITVTAAMISAFSDRCTCFCHSQKSSLAPSLPPDLSQGTTAGKHGQRYLIFLHAEDYGPTRPDCVFSGYPTLK